MKILIVDSYWQTPTTTEQHAFEKVKVFHDPTFEDVVYLAFPWATLFDLYDSNQDSVYKELKDLLNRVTSQIPPSSRVVTVCQHISLERHKYFLINLKSHSCKRFAVIIDLALVFSIKSTGFIIDDAYQLAVKI